MDATITLKQYLEKNKTFVIPDYQRGYVWGKKRDNDNSNSVNHIIDDLITRFKNKADVFLQGFTVTEKTDEIIIIDGQQRTTCLYLLFKWLGYHNKFDIRYEIREKSNEFLKTFKLDDVDEDPSEEYQDIFFFKKTIRIIRDKLKDIDKKEFLVFLLDKVKFLYINVEERQATKVFAMMNGSKAEMQQEEIIKAEILRLASLNMDLQTDYTQEWEHNMLRSRYAREWDKWLRWWNNPNVQSLFQCQNNMGLLISSYLHLKKGDKLSFECFKAEYLSKAQSIEAKKTFDGLRRLQKRFEDAYNNPIEHNMIGAVLRILDSDNQKKFIHYYFDFVNDHCSELGNYYNLAFLEMTHDEITNKDSKKFEEKFEEKFDKMLLRLSEDLLYEVDKEAAFRFLLRLNIDEDNKQNGGDGRFFDFSIWDNGVRSLEHVFPKSKVGHSVTTSDGEYWEGGDNNKRAKNEFSCFRDEIKKKDGTCQTTEHSIGNLVLLYKGDNSTFSNNDFKDKKNYFFNTDVKEFFNSRHLLHTIYIFANSEWEATNIAENKERLINQFKKYYEK